MGAQDAKVFITGAEQDVPEKDKIESAVPVEVHETGPAPQRLPFLGSRPAARVTSSNLSSSVPRSSASEW
jgi:hypothetical protein